MTIQLLPEGWTEVRLGEVASVSRGASPRPIASSRWFSESSNVGWVRIADLGRSDGLILKATTQRLSPDGIARSRFLQPGTLIMSIAATVGVPIVTGIPACIHDGFVAIERLRGVDQSYLLYTLKSLESELRSAGQTGSQSNVNTEIVNNLRVKMPPIKEQVSIAASLEDIDQLIITLEHLIAKKQSIKQGMMQQLLTGKTRLAGFSTPWSRSTVGNIADVKTGPFGSALHESDYVSDGTPIITVEHLGERGVVSDEAPMVSDADRHRLRAYSLRAGDVVFSRVGSIDRNALISRAEEGWLFSGRLLRVRFDRKQVDPAFMSAQFHAKPFREAVRSVAVGQTMPSLNTAILRGIAVDLPSLIEQKAIGKAASDLNGDLDLLEHRLLKARSIKQGMMQELLTGRTRLPIEEAIT